MLSKWHYCLLQRFAHAIVRIFHGCQSWRPDPVRSSQPYLGCRSFAHVLRKPTVTSKKYSIEKKKCNCQYTHQASPDFTPISQTMDSDACVYRYYASGTSRQSPVHVLPCDTGHPLRRCEEVWFLGNLRGTTEACQPDHAVTHGDLFLILLQIRHRAARVARGSLLNLRDEVSSW